MSYDKMNITKSWMYRKCIKCKSNFVIYEDGIMIMNCNNIPKLYMVRQLITLPKLMMDMDMDMDIEMTNLKD
jgi:hypothetical protein